MDVGGIDFEVWRWVFTLLVGAIGGIFTVAIATSRKINQLDNITTDIAIIKKVLFKDSGGLNLMSEDRHTEVCQHTFTLWGKDIDRIEEKVDNMVDKLDLVVNSAATAKEYADEMRRMSDMIERLVNAWRVDQDKRTGKE